MGQKIWNLPFFTLNKVDRTVYATITVIMILAGFEVLIWERLKNILKLGTGGTKKVFGLIFRKIKCIYFSETGLISCEEQSLLFLKRNENGHQKWNWLIKILDCKLNYAKNWFSQVYFH